MDGLRLTKDERIYLWNGNDFPLKTDVIDQYAPALIPYPGAEREKPPAKLPVMLVCPGGGFVYKEMYKEGEQIALMANKLGMYAFVLDYRVFPYTHPCQILDLQRSIRFIRYHADDYRVDPDKICVIGFSAGGSMAALAAVERPGGDANAPDPVDRLNAKPDAAVLCYAVTNLKGIEPVQKIVPGNAAPDPKACRHYDFISRAGNIECPLFIWATCNDQSVPSLQSLELAEQLKKKGKDFELHIYENGPHGLSVSRHNGAVAQWIPAMTKFLSRNSFDLNQNAMAG
jgi:acetyl esterase/lipase